MKPPPSSLPIIAPLLFLSILASCTAPVETATAVGHNPPLQDPPPPVPPPGPPPPPPVIPWSRLFGATGGGDQWGSFAMRSSGSVIALIERCGGVDFGEGPIETAVATDNCLAEYDEIGSLRWMHRFVATEFQWLNMRVAAGDADTSLLTFGTMASASLGFGEPIESPAALVIAKFDGKGNGLYARNFGTGMLTTGYVKAAVRPDRHAFVAGVYTPGAIDLGDGPIVCNSDMCSFLLELDENGKRVASRVLPSNNITFNSIQFGAGDEIILAGQFNDQLDLGDGPHPCPFPMSPYVAKLPSIMEAPIWTNAYCGEEEQWANDALIGPDGSIYFAGEYLPPLDLGGGPIEPPPVGEWGAFVAKLNPDGSHVWSRSLGAGAATALAFSPSGVLLVSGPFGAYTDTAVGYLHELDPDTGNSIKLRSVNAPAGTGTISLTAMSVDKGIMIGGRLRENSWDPTPPQATLDFGSGLLVNQGGFDAFVAVVAP